MPDPPELPSRIPLDRFKRAAIDRLNNHLGEMSLEEYSAARWAIEGALNRGSVRDHLREATGEEIPLE